MGGGRRLTNSTSHLSEPLSTTQYVILSPLESKVSEPSDSSTPSPTNHITACGAGALARECTNRHQPSILVILSEVGSVAHDRSRAVERSLPAPQPMWGGHSCPPTYESSRTTWGQPPSPCPERSRRRCPPSDAGGSAGASVLARATRTGGHGFSHAEKHRPPIQAPMRRNYSSLVPRCGAGALARECTNRHQPRILVILSEVGSVAHDRSRAVERSLPAPRTV
jgi:hypothetical protein